MNRGGKASRSRLGTPIIGRRRAWASALAGGDPDAQPGEHARARCRRRRRRCRAARRGSGGRGTRSTGVSVSAWRLPRDEYTAPRIPSWPPMAQPTRAVDVLMPRISIRRRPGTVDPRRRARRRATADRADQPGPTGRSCSRRSSSPSPKRQPDLEEVVGQHRQDRVAPLDEHHAAVVEHLGQPEVEGLVDLLEPVDVEVVDRAAGPRNVDQREGRAGDALVHAERAAEALHEGGLARAEVAGQHARRRRAGPARRPPRARSRVASTDAVRALTGRSCARPAGRGGAWPARSPTASATAPPPRPAAAAAGWKVGTSHPVRNGYAWPRSLVIPTSVSQQPLRREVPQRDDDPRRDQVDLLRRARASTSPPRRASGRGSRAAGTWSCSSTQQLIRVRPSSSAMQSVEELARAADEREALLVLLGARALADEHQVGVGDRPCRTPPGCGPPARRHAVQVEACAARSSSVVGTARA